MKSKYLLVILVVAALALVVAGGLVAQKVGARAGGGQDYVPSSGGSSSSGSSGFGSSGSSFDSSSSSGGSVGSWGWGGIVGFVIFVIILAVVIGAIKRARRGPSAGSGQAPSAGPSTSPSTSSGQSSGPGTTIYVGGVPINIGPSAGPSTSSGPSSGQAVPTVPVANIPAELARLQQKDPAFNEQAFKDYAQNAFYKVQQAWESQNLQIGRPFMTDQLMQRYATQISDIQSRGEKNILENMVLGHMNITNIRTDNAYDYITLQMEASAADYTLDRNGKFLRGSKKPEHFTEYWTFLRKVGAKTNAQKSVKANVCPNCGAALQLSATGQCQYCNAVVTSGEWDWVLSEITQAQ